MMAKCLLLVLLKVIHAVVHFGAFDFNLCYSGDNKFSVLVGRTIEQCMDECIAREHCKALNFRTKMKICELFATTSAEHFSPGECLYADKTNMQPSSTQNICKRGEVQETNGCVIKECINITIPVHGSVLGNMRNVGKDIRYKCEHGYKVKNNVPTPVAECLETGLWSVNVECVNMAYTWASWTGWSQCSVSCGGGQRTRTRSCTIPIQGIDDVQCLQDDPVNHPGIESETCNHPTCEAPTIGKLCTVDADCIETEGMCIGGRCFCNPLYRYNVSLQNCIKVCDSLTDEFDVFHHFAIAGYNDIHHEMPAASIDTCIKACISMANCRSFDSYSKFGILYCNLSQVSRDMILDALPGHLLDYHVSSIYTRKCK